MLCFSKRWLCKHQMIEKWGEHKAERRILVLEKDPKKHRPDEITGEDDEHMREYNCEDYLKITTTADREDFSLSCFTTYRSWRSAPL